MLLGKDSAVLIGKSASLFLDEDKSELEAAIKKGDDVVHLHYSCV